MESESAHASFHPNRTRRDGCGSWARMARQGSCRRRRAGRCRSTSCGHGRRSSRGRASGVCRGRARVGEERGETAAGAGWVRGQVELQLGCDRCHTRRTSRVSMTSATEMDDRCARGRPDEIKTVRAGRKQGAPRRLAGGSSALRPDEGPDNSPMTQRTTSTDDAKIHALCHFRQERGHERVDHRAPASCRTSRQEGRGTSYDVTARRGPCARTDDDQSDSPRAQDWVAPSAAAR